MTYLSLSVCGHFYDEAHRDNIHPPPLPRTHPYPLPTNIPTPTSWIHLYLHFCSYRDCNVSTNIDYCFVCNTNVLRTYGPIFNVIGPRSTSRAIDGQLNHCNAKALFIDSKLTVLHLTILDINITLKIAPGSTLNQIITCKAANKCTVSNLYIHIIRTSVKWINFLVFISVYFYNNSSAVHQLKCGNYHAVMKFSWIQMGNMMS